jgi:hypothetical protein
VPRLRRSVRSRDVRFTIEPRDEGGALASMFRFSGSCPNRDRDLCSRRASERNHVAHESCHFSVIALRV